EGVFGQKGADLAVRLFMAVVCLRFVTRKILEFEDYYSKALWGVETLLFCVLFFAYVKRSPPVDRAVGFKRVAIPLFGGALPFGLLISEPSAAIYGREWALDAVFGAMSAATALTVWGMWALRGSFSITAEARKLVTGGPYRFVRHPVYLGEMLAAAGVTVWRFSPLSLIILALFIAVQLYRSRVEEEVLARAFPEYREKLGKSFWFW
ncbi:isoprenylcysteine carboxylmethyltransferase family protein, partial [bacterium]